MPELPEVETIKKELEEKILGKKIAKAELILPKITNFNQKDFIKRIKNSKIIFIERKAKNLVIKLSNKENILIHLKLTGQLIYFAPKKYKKQKYTHLIFYFSDGSKLLYNDLRQFGYVKLLSTEELEKYFKKQNFGINPIDKNFTLTKFNEMLKKKRGKIKVVLMDQKFIAGIGNLYAAEICYFAKVRPDKEISKLNGKKVSELFQGIKKILQKAIKYKGSSVENYVDIYGKKGEFVPHLKVYRREGKKCLRCGVEIKAMKLGGRGTYFCPQCQK
ncbi:MAG: bifunctional DNA-formamidopyrimidine glycosylase/DNA-(apurinic or apyrimidinic site) lyase [bacterium]